jgi:DNA-binding IclR family transcriptional regulator
LNASDLRFNGSDYDRERDDARLSGQALRIFDLMKDGQWRTLNQIASATGDPPASVSAQLRHLRKSRFGSHAVNKRHLGNGLYEYQVIP